MCRNYEINRLIGLIGTSMSNIFISILKEVIQFSIVKYAFLLVKKGFLVIMGTSLLIWSYLVLYYESICKFQFLSCMIFYYKLYLTAW